MRNLIFVLTIVLSSGAKAQSISEILVGNTWNITSLELNGEELEESQNTCIYSTTIYFESDTQVTTNSTCKAPFQDSYTISDSLLIINTDTLQMINMSMNNFQTITTKNAMISHEDEIFDEAFIEIITYYEKE